MEVGIAFAPVHVLAARIAVGKLDPVDLLDLYLERIARFDAALHSYVHVAAESSIVLAKSRAMAVRGGGPLGPLHGVPIAVKDLCDIAGLASGAGSGRRSHMTADSTSVVVERLLNGGAVILGKRHMTEFAFGAWGTNAVLGTPRNPWDAKQHRVPGGSSSGSGVAVAAGLAPAAIGSDTGGSVRIPASFCGTVDLKTTHGRNSTSGIVPLSRNLDTIGPLTRCVPDAALLLRVLADDYAGGRPLAGLSSIAGGIAGLRLGVPPRSQLGEVAPAVYDSFRVACKLLERLGARIDETAFPDGYFDSAADMQSIISAEAYAVNAEIVMTSGPTLDPHVLARLLRGKAVSAAQYITACERQRGDRARVLRWLDEFAAVLTPTTAIAAIPVAEVDEMSPTPSRLTRPINYLGLCALALPCGVDGEGMPLSFQIVGRPNTEETILRIGSAYEQVASALGYPNLDGFSGDIAQRN